MWLFFRLIPLFAGVFFRRLPARLAAGALALGLTGLPVLSRAQAPAFGPAVVIGTPAFLNGQSTVTGTALDAQGYVYVTGSYYGTVQFGSFTLSSATTQAYVAKLDGAGSFQWLRTVDRPYLSVGSGVAVDATGTVTIVGSFSEATATFGPFSLTNANQTSHTSDIYVAQLDAAGTWLWATQAGGPGFDGAAAVALDATGNVYVTGAYASVTAAFGATTLSNANPATTSTNSYDLFVGQLTPQGSWQWARSGGGGRHDGGRALAVTARGTVYLTGNTQGASATFGPFALPGAAGTNDAVLVAKLDTNGTWQWVATGGGGVNDDSGAAIALDAADNAYVAGSFTSPTATFGTTTLANSGYGGGGYGDVFVARLDASGSWQWAVRAGSDKNDGGTGLLVDAAGRLVVGGTFGGSTARFGTTSLANTAGGGGGAGGTFNPSSIFLAYLSPAGTWLGAVASQGGGDEQPVCLAADAYGNTSLGGSFQGPSLTLGTATLAGAGSSTATTGFATLVPMLPVVANLAPGSGAPGQVVTVTGSGFVGVVEVLFNGVSAAAFTVQSASKLVATVPPGATAGPVRVRTSVGAANSPQPFQTLPLAAGAAASPTAPLVWPNPVRVAEPWQVHLATTTRLEVRSLIDQLVFQTQLSGQAQHVPVPPLAPGFYHLTLLPVGQPAQQQRVVVVE